MFRVIQMCGFNRAHYWHRRADHTTTEEERRRFDKITERELYKTEDHIQRIEELLGEEYTMVIAIRVRL